MVDSCRSSADRWTSDTGFGRLCNGSATRVQAKSTEKRKAPFAFRFAFRLLLACTNPIKNNEILKILKKIIKQTQFL
jgi:hypothetical protein